MRRLAPPQRLAQQSPPTTVPQVTVHHYSSSEKLIPAIPGFRTSAAFLTSLSANLRIDPDLPSPLLTPNFRAAPSGFPLPPPSPLSFSTSSTQDIPGPFASPSESNTMPSSPATSTTKNGHLAVPPPNFLSTEPIPQLQTYTASSPSDRTTALRLIADSIAQQRQTAAKALIYHPLNLALYFLFVSIVAKYLWRTPDDLLPLCTTLAGLTSAYLLAIRLAVGGYLVLAEQIGWEWLGEDRVVVVKWGEEIIGALVLGWADNSEGARKRGTRRRRGKAVVRAWTVKLKYRGKGVGEALLEEAVRVAGERGADGIVWSAEHANSNRILPWVYNGFLDRQERRAEKKLEKVADEKGNFRQRRSSPTWGSR